MKRIIAGYAINSGHYDQVPDIGRFIERDLYNSIAVELQKTGIFHVECDPGLNHNPYEKNFSITGFFMGETEFRGIMSVLNILINNETDDYKKAKLVIIKQYLTDKK